MDIQNIKTGVSAFTVVERAVIYARVSKDDRSNEGRNLTGQLEMGRSYAAEKGYRIIEELAEDERGASGAEIDLPQLDRARQLAHDRAFEVLIVRELDRLSRNLAKQLIVEEELRQAGVRIEYVLSDYDDTPEGRLQKHIRATVAEYEREKIRERMVRGRRNKIKAGNILTSRGRCPYGYKIEIIDGKVHMVLNPETVNYVRLMFRWYGVGGLSMGEISRRLAQMGAPIPEQAIRKNHVGWLASSLSKMLKNETYTGTWYYGKYNSRKRQINPREDWIGVPVPPVVSLELWQKAQDRLQQNKEESKRNRKHQYLLSHKVTCGHCGCKCSGRRGGRNRNLSYYICNSYQNDEMIRDCNMPHFRADIIDKLIWEWLKSLLLTPENLEKGLQAYQTELEARQGPLRDRLKVVDGLLEDNETKLEKLLDLYLAGKFPEDILLARKNNLETAINSLKKEQSSLLKQLMRDQLSEEEMQTIREFARTVRQGIQLAADADNFYAKRKIIDLLSVQVTIVVENDEKVVYAKCLIGDTTMTITSTTIGGLPAALAP